MTDEPSLNLSHTQLHPYDLPSIFDTSNSFDLKLAFFQFKSKLNTMQLTHIQQTEDLKLRHFQDKQQMRYEYEDKLRKLRDDLKAMQELKEETLLLTNEKIDQEQAEMKEQMEAERQQMRLLQRQLVEMRISSLQENRELRDTAQNLQRKLQQLTKEKQELMQKLLNITSSQIDNNTIINAEKIHDCDKQNMSFGLNVSEIKFGVRFKEDQLRVLEKQYQDQNDKLKRVIQDLKSKANEVPVEQGSLIRSYDELESVRNELEEIRYTNTNLKEELTQAQRLILQQKNIVQGFEFRNRQRSKQQQLQQAKLQQIMQEFTAEITKGRNTIENYQQELESSKKYVASLETFNGELKGELVKVLTEKDELTNHLQKSLKQLEQTKSLTNSMENELKSTQARLVQSQQQIYQSTKQTQIMKQTILTSQKFKNTSMDLQEETSLLRQKLNTMQNLLAFKDDVIVNMKTDTERLAGLLDTVRNVSKAETERFKQNQEHFKKQSEDYKLRIKQTVQINSSLKTEVGILKNSIEFLQSEQSNHGVAHQQQFNNLNKQISFKDMELQRLKQQLLVDRAQFQQQLRNATAQLTRSFNQLTQVKHQSQSRLIEKENQLRILRQQNDFFKGEIKKHDEQTMSVKQSVSQSNKQNQQLKNKIAQYIEKLKIISNQYEILQIKNREVQRQLQQVQTSFSLSKSRCTMETVQKKNAFSEELSRLNTELFETKKRSFEQKIQFQEKNRTIQTQYQTLKQQHSKLQSSLNEKQNCIDTLTKKLNQLTHDYEHLKYKLKEQESNNDYQQTSRRRLQQSEIYVKPSEHARLIAPLLTPKTRKDTQESFYCQTQESKRMQTNQLLDEVQRLRKAKYHAQDQSRQVAMELYKVRKEYDQNTHTLKKQLLELRQTVIQKEHLLTKSQFLSSDSSQTTPSFLNTQQPQPIKHKILSTQNQDNLLKRQGRSKQKTTAAQCHWTSTKLTDSSWSRARSRTQWQLSTIVCRTPKH